MIDIHKIEPFFDGWEEPLIRSCLQGYMGYAITDNDEKPSAALITVALAEKLGYHMDSPYPVYIRK